MRATTVGFSGSGASRRALRWAVQSCAATARPLHVVVGPGGRHTDLDGVLTEELERVPGRAPRVDVTLTTDDPVATLLRAAADGADLVLGCGRDVGPGGPGAGVLGAVLAEAPGPVVLVGPRAVLTPPRRLVVVGSADDAVADWVLRRGRDLPVHLLTAWWAPSGAGDGGSGRRHAHLCAVAVHHTVRARLSAGTHRVVRAEVAEGALADVLPRRLAVGDLVVLAAGSAGSSPWRTLRAPAVLVPARDRAGHRVVDLREHARELTPARPT